MSPSGTTHCIAIRSAAVATLRSGDEGRLEMAVSKQSHKLASVSVSASERTGAGAGEEDGSMEEKQTTA